MGFLSHSLSTRLISVDPALGLGEQGCGVSTHLLASLPLSLSVHLIPSGALEAGAQGISIAVVIHSVDPHPTNGTF